MTSARPGALSVRAPAKINLSLRVLGVRADGYHELRTTFQSIALHDMLVFRPRIGKWSLTCDAAACPVDESNLVWQAGLRLWRADGRRGAPRDVAIHIAKRIPMQSGLGGGSSDAAAALRGLAAFWRTRVTDATLRAIAKDLGSDVPFFLAGGTALGVDRGSVVYPLPDYRSSAVVLVQPDFGVSTKEAYSWWDADHAAGKAAHETRGARETGGGLPETGNDLERPVAMKHPQIGRIVRQLVRRGATYSAMSGSGSVVFGLFPRRRQALDVAAAVAAPGRVVTVTQTLQRHEYARLTAPRRFLVER
jgi:4-diphosphocytidyl-2-C-methyl-D-erythritol kinase